MVWENKKDEQSCGQIMVKREKFSYGMFTGKRWDPRNPSRGEGLKDAGTELSVHLKVAVHNMRQKFKVRT